MAEARRASLVRFLLAKGTTLADVRAAGYSVADLLGLRPAPPRTLLVAAGYSAEELHSAGLPCIPLDAGEEATAELRLRRLRIMDLFWHERALEELRHLGAEAWMLDLLARIRLGDIGALQALLQALDIQCTAGELVALMGPYLQSAGHEQDNVETVGSKKCGRLRPFCYYSWASLRLWAWFWAQRS